MQTRRQEILAILKRQAEATVDELATVLDLTPVTVRHHLDILRADGLVETSAVRRRRGPGRPQYVYTLTPDADSHFPSKYDSLANELLGEIKTRLSDSTVQEMLDSIAGRRLNTAPMPGSNATVEERLEILAAYMTEQGHIASWEHKDDKWYIYASNCPYHNVATQHPELCSVDLYLFEQLAGAKIVRRDSMAAGGHCCVYEVLVEADD